MANSKLYTYDPAQVSAVIGGNIVSGLADGTFITVERNADSWASKVGTDGVVTRVKSNNKSGKVTVVLNQGSPTNDALAAIQILDEQNNAGVVTFMLRDGTGKTLCTAAQMWLTKPPTVEYGREAMDRTWVFESNSIDVYLAGNNS